MDETDIFAELTQEFKFYLDVLVARISGKWSQFDRGIFTDHSVEVTDIEHSEEGLSAELICGGVGAWVLEYGSGSAMDISNPYFGDYKASFMWNPYRSNNEITGRSEGDQIVTVDGSVRTSSGKLKGVNLEREDIGNGPYVPESPRHIVELEIKAWLPELEESMNAKISNPIKSAIEGAF